MRGGWSHRGGSKTVMVVDQVKNFSIAAKRGIPQTIRTERVFGNGNIDQAMQDFPPDGAELQKAFVAVFTGPESPMGVQLSEEPKLD